MKPLKILVTGSGGFVFSNFIRHAIYTKQNYTIVSIDKVRPGYTLRNMYVNKNHQFYPGDITDIHFLNVIFEFEKPDIVIHGAAETSVDNSIVNAVPFITSNILGTQNIIDMCLKWEVKKLIYVSSDEVYGQLLNESEKAFVETDKLNPRNPYAVSKASGELLVKAAHETHKLNYVITRSCNNYGPWQGTEKFIPKIIKNILNKERIPIYGEGMQIREWLHVLDHCSAIIKIINNGDINTVYNISAGQEIRNIELFQVVCNILNSGHDLVDCVTDRAGHDFRCAIDNKKIKDLGWKPDYKFKDGLSASVDWYLKNQWYFRLGQ